MRKIVTRSARYAAYVAGAVVALFLAAALILPEFLDTPAVGREIQAKLSQAVHGEIGWKKLSIRLLPSPRVALSEVRADIPDVANVRAEEVDVHLRLLPLFRGRAEVASVSVSKPQIRVEMAQAPPAKEKPREETRGDPVESYRSAVDAIRGFAPEAVLDIEDADLDVRVTGMPPIRVRGLTVHGRTGSEGMEIELTAASDVWTRLKLSASIEYADLSGAAKLDVAGLKPQAWLDLFLAQSPVGIALPAASLRAQARTDGKTRLEGDLDLRAETVEIVRAAERVRVSAVAVTGKVAASREEIAVRLSSAQLGASKLAAGSLSYSPKTDSFTTLAEFDLDLAQAMDASRRLIPEQASKSLAPVQSVTGRAQGRVKFDLQRSGWSALVEIRQSDSSIGIEGLPGPVKLAAGSVNITRDAVKIDRADMAMLDSRATASATIGYGKQLRIEGAVSDGNVGESTRAWVWKTAHLPPRVILKTPIRVEVQKVAWSPKQPLDLTATAAFDAGPSIAVDLGWTPDSLDIRRVGLKDERSDAAIALRTKGRLLEGRFSGSLTGVSVRSMLKGAQIPSGSASGDLRFTVDLDQPRRTTAMGDLKAQALDLTLLLDRPVKIERIDLAADGTSLRIRDARVNWAEQIIGLRGDVKYGAGGPVVDAQLESPGVVVDALLRKTGEDGPRAPEEKKKPEPAKGDAWKIWPLPVTGRIAVRSDFIQYGERKAAPVAAALTLGQKRAYLELKQVKLCGISLPLTVEATPDGFAIAVRITAQKQELEQAARCLTERGILITGEFDLQVDLRTRGRVSELVRNLEGSVSAQSRDGRVMKFTLLGNILSTQKVAELLKGEPKVDEQGFPYRLITTAGRFDKGEFIIDESFFRSDVIGLAARGSISLIDYDSKLTVLVAPLGRLDQLVRMLPIFGYVVGGALTSVPVGVSGDIRNPRVVPLSPSAVGSELWGIFERTLKLPAHLLEKAAQPPSP